MRGGASSAASRLRFSIFETEFRVQNLLTHPSGFWSQFAPAIKTAGAARFRKQL